ncbi:DUF411 domain-containing protein [Lysobacter brunescens]|uniref:DUF411 domain-containing protein n=1 Tax=Lysobacter brunescens TaxID=262323 RepID=A0ABW2YJH7_9GAMM
MKTTTTLLALAGLLPLLAMAQAAPQKPVAPAKVPTSAAAASPARAPAKPGGLIAALPTMVVYKTPTCGCCKVWVKHMEQAGFKVQTRDLADLGAVKARLGVPYGKGSCHTAEVGGYFVEGHVPAADVKRMLAEKPAARGLTVPGMPLGSPGMEVPDGTVEAYAVELVGRDGKTRVFSRHGK